jgi:hypothetical protein
MKQKRSGRLSIVATPREPRFGREKMNIKNLWMAISVCLFSAAFRLVPVSAAPVAPPPMANAPHGLSTIPPAAVGAGMTFTVSKGRLIARDIHTARERWTFGRDIVYNPDPCDPVSGIILYSGQSVYTVSDSGRVYALQAKTGRLLWQSARTRDDEVLSMETLADQLIVFGSRDMRTFGVSDGRMDGRIILKHSPAPGLLPLVDQEAVLVSYYESGAYTASETDAYDRRTRRFLWTQTGQAESLAADTVTLRQYFPESDPVQHPRITRVTVDSRTGKVLTSVVLAP